MIVYRELASVERDLGIPAKTLYAVSNSLRCHYHTAKIPKEDGSVRTLTVPDPLLKHIQRRIADVLLSQMPVSPWATAYRPGGGALVNAVPHAGQPRILKLDIRHFFDSILYSTVKDRAFPAEKYAEPIRILLAMLCYYRDSLPQGAPTSPAISNLVLRDFDHTVGTWCRRRGITYTRYCDDMTFSGDFDPKDVLDFVEPALRKEGFFLHPGKIVTAHRGQRQTVTGLVVNDRPAVPAAYRRKLRQEIYYCRKFGVKEHLQQTGNEMDPAAYLRSLLGRVNYVLSVHPDDREFLTARAWLAQATAWYSTQSSDYKEVLSDEPQ